MSFPKYSAYTRTGIAWMPEIPSHWALTRLGRVTISKCDGPFGSGLKSEHYVESGVRVIRLQNIRHGRFDGSDQAYIDEKYYREELSDHDLREGDVLVAGLGDERNTVGRACVAPHGIAPAMVKADCFRFRVDQGLALPAFTALQLTAGSECDAGILSSDSTRSSISLSTTASRALALPSLDEQVGIIDFIEVETAKIDALIAEQQRLMELLQEKRQAVISHAVTKGLNPDAPMKPSGIEWIGDVPAHWCLTPLKHVAEFINGDAFKPTEWAESGTPIIRIQNLNGGEDFNYFDGEVEPRYLVRDGDLLFGWSGNRGTSFGPFIWRSDRVCALNQHIFRVVPRGLDTSALYWTLKAVTAHVEDQAHGIIGMVHITKGDLGAIRVPIPPSDEHRRIAAFLRSETAKVDNLVIDSRRAIDLLAERRAALISAAVTGQVDIRGLNGAEAA